MAKTDKTIEKVTSQDVRRLIADRHGIVPALPNSPRTAAEWALFFELRNGTGFNGGAGENYADALAINLYPSKKHWRVAYEIKISRSDFLHELKNPHKRQWAFDISNEFWFACAPGVAKPEELPEGCGLLVVSGAKLKRVVAAKQRTARALGMGEVAAIARKSMDAGAIQDAKWRHAGCDLDESALDELLAAKWDQQREHYHQKVAEDWTKAKMADIAKALLQAKEAMATAGIQPFPWMANLEGFMEDPRCRLSGNYSHLMADWVRANVSPGPNAQGLTQAIAEHARATNELKRMRETANGYLDRMDAQLAMMGRAIEQTIGYGPDKSLGLAETDEASLEKQ